MIFPVSALAARIAPLIENAIKYAVTPAEDGADIWLTAEREGHAIRISVVDALGSI
mgnify:CR=1 FL=1